MQPTNHNWYRDASLAEKSQWYGRVSEAYDRTRPGYSQEFIDRIVEVTNINPNSRILEIGCGPGTATKSLATLNCSIVALEPNCEACQLAKQNCLNYPKVELINITFEEWELPFDRFDAVVAATSFHWIDPDIVYQKTFEALKDCGYLILLWNTPPQPNHDFYYKFLSEIYQIHTPELQGYESTETNKKNIGMFGDNVINSKLFERLITEKSIDRVNYSIDDYLALLSTLSPYIALKPETRNNLFNDLKQRMQTCGKNLSLSYLSLLQIFQKIS
jgi:SAM-dependent methyltransferase